MVVWFLLVVLAGLWSLYVDPSNNMDQYRIIDGVLTPVKRNQTNFEYIDIREVARMKSK